MPDPHSPSPPATPQGAAPAPGLLRVAGRWQILALSLNDVIGSGIYLLPAAAALWLGPASLWAVALAGVTVFLVVLCFAEAATHFDEPGGAYLYAREAFGELAGFQVGWMTWLARVASVAALSAGFAQAMTWAVPAAAGGWVEKLFILGSLAGLTAINVLGVRAAIRTAVAFTIAKVVPLLVFVGAGLAAARWETVAGQPDGEGSLGAAALLLLYAYAGFENTPAPAGEFRHPRRDVPFALVVHIGLVTALYVAVQWVALGTLPGIGGSETPLADAAALFLGPWAGALLTVGGAISILGTNNNTVLAGPRYLFALARDGFGPAWLARVHPRFRTPAAAVLLQSALAVPLAVTGSFVGLAALSVVARLVTYLGTAAAVPVLRRRGSAPADAFRLPGGIAIPIAAIAVSLGLAASAELRNLVVAAIALVVGLVVFRLRRRGGEGS